MVAVAAFALLGAQGAVLWVRGLHQQGVMHRESFGLTWCQTLLLTLSEPVCVFRAVRRGWSLLDCCWLASVVSS